MVDDERTAASRLPLSVDGTESERQLLAADSLPISIAILDTEGTIIETNAAWRAFGERNGIARRPDSVGLNYLEVAKTGDDEAARKAVAGLTDVCNGTREQFSLEYPCHTPDQKQWFLLRASPFTANGSRYVTVAHIDITDRKERERALANEREALDRQLQLADTLFRTVKQVAEASTVEELEGLVCETLAESPVYSAVWIAARRRGEADGFESVASAGISAGTLETVVKAFGSANGDSSPLKRAFETGAVHCHQELFATSGSSSTPLIRRGDRAMAFVPFGNEGDGVIERVCCLQTTRSTAFDNRERQQLRELGTRLGADRQAIEVAQLAHADRRTELEFRCTSDTIPAVEVSDVLDCRLELQEITLGPAGSVISQLAVDGASPERCRDRLKAAGVEAVHVVDSDSTRERGRIKCHSHKNGCCPLVTLTNSGAAVRSAVYENGVGTIAAQTTPEANTRAIVEAFQAAIPEADFLSTEMVTTRSSHLSGTRPLHPLGQLTDRQQEVLEAATDAGYFESPRRTSAQTLADSLGITPATFYQHLRKAHQNLLTRLLSEAGGDADRP